MEFLTEYGLFLAKTLTLVLALVFVLSIIVANASRHKGEGKHKGEIHVTKINDELERLRDDIRHEVLDEDTLKAMAKADKKQDKSEKKAHRKSLKAHVAEPERKRVYVLEFDGDTHASEVEGWQGNRRW